MLYFIIFNLLREVRYSLISFFLIYEYCYNYVMGYPLHILATDIVQIIIACKCEGLCLSWISHHLKSIEAYFNHVIE